MQLIIESNQTASWKIVGVSIIQTAGSFIALVLHYLNSRIYGHMAASTFWGISAAISLVFLTSLLIGLTSEPVLEFFSKTVRAFLKAKLSVTPRKASSAALAKIVRTFAILDFIAVAICIINTGGSERSIYGPFLFIIVPVLLIVRAMKPFELIIYTVISLTIYALGLCPLVCQKIWPGITKFSFSGALSHSILLAISTMVCIAFPLLYTIAEQWCESGLKESPEGEPTKSDNKVIADP